MDEELKDMTREELMGKVKKLRRGVLKHRDSSGHDLCWFHSDLWKLTS